MRSVLMTLSFILVLGFLSACSEDATIPVTGTAYGTLIYDDGHPAAGMLVLVEFTGLSTVTEPNGDFVINGLLAVDETGMGRYYNLRGSGCRQSGSYGFFLPGFKIKGQQSYSTGTVIVHQTGEIQGRILMSDNPDGDNSGVRLSLEGTSLQSITRADGGFSLAEVPAFNGYIVICEREGYETLVLEEMIVDGRSQPITLAPGAILDLGPHFMDPF